MSSEMIATFEIAQPRTAFIVRCVCSHNRMHRFCYPLVPMCDYVFRTWCKSRIVAAPECNAESNDYNLVVANRLFVLSWILMSKISQVWSRTELTLKTIALSDLAKDSIQTRRSMILTPLKPKIDRASFPNHSSTFPPSWIGYSQSHQNLGFDLITSCIRSSKETRIMRSGFGPIWLVFICDFLKSYEWILAWIMRRFPLDTSLCVCPNALGCFVDSHLTHGTPWNSAIVLTGMDSLHWIRTVHRRTFPRLTEFEVFYVNKWNLARL